MNIYLTVADKFGLTVDSNLMDAVDISGVTEQEWSDNNKVARQKIMDALSVQTDKMIKEEMVKGAPNQDQLIEMLMNVSNQIRQSKING